MKRSGAVCREIAMGHYGAVGGLGPGSTALCLWFLGVTCPPPPPPKRRGGWEKGSIDRAINQRL